MVDQAESDSTQLVSCRPLDRAVASFQFLQNMAPIVTSWSSLDYESGQQQRKQQQGTIYPFRLRQNSVSVTPPSNHSSLKSYGSVSSFESDPFASLSNPPAKPPRAYPSPGRHPPFGKFHPQGQSANRSKSHSDLVGHLLFFKPELLIVNWCNTREEKEIRQRKDKQGNSKLTDVSGLSGWGQVVLVQQVQPNNIKIEKRERLLLSYFVFPFFFPVFAGCVLKNSPLRGGTDRREILSMKPTGNGVY